MNRKSFLTPFKTKSTVAAMSIPSSASRPTGTLTPYSGYWSKKEAKHLLRATMFGPKKIEIDSFSPLGMNLSVAKILTPLPVIAPPISTSTTQGDIENLPWHLSNAKVNNFNRKKSLKAWMLSNMIHQEASIGEKMLLFWHNHFVTGMDSVDDARFTYYYIKLLRQYSLGNVKTLTKKISTNAAMLKYLSGDSNVKGAPNENYARELMELFTLGAVDKDGNPNYIEKDVEEAARVLTGWKTVNSGNGTILSPHSSFDANKHDNQPKQFSAHFNNKIIHRILPTDYQKELDDLIDMIFARKETALFIVRQVYAWFIHYDIDALTEQNIITPLAKLLRDGNYEIKPVLETLLKSQHFYDQFARGTSVKTPADFVVGSIRQLEANLPLNFPIESYHLLYKIDEHLRDMQMDILNPPNVAGWSAFYQSPGYYQIWINTATYQVRSEFALTLLKNGIYSPTQRFKADLPKFLNLVTNVQASDINVLIDSCCDLLFPLDITANQKQYLKDILLQGLPDFEWTVEWTQFTLANIQPDSPSGYAMRKKLEDFFIEIFNMAEYHLN